MGKAIARHEMIADYLDEMTTDVQALRALAVAGAFHEEMSQKLELIGKFTETVEPGEAASDSSAASSTRARSRRLTPLLKYLATEKAVEIARRNMQIHGGVGYTKDYGAEKLLARRDGHAHLRGHQPDPVADGDEGHALRHHQEAAGVRGAHGAGALADGVGARSARAARRQLQTLSLSAQQLLLTRTAADKLKTLTDVPVARVARRAQGLGSEARLLARHAARRAAHRILTDEAMAELLLEQAKAHPERREVLERWLERAELRSKALYEEITTTGERILRLARSRRRPAAERVAAE